jgi:hypothetical protein
MIRGQATARFNTYVDYKSEESESHITTFRGIKTGIIVTVIFFWIPFIVIYHLFGWFYLVVCGAALVAIFSALGLLSRWFRSLKSTVRTKSSAEVF